MLKLIFLDQRVMYLMVTTLVVYSISVGFTPNAHLVLPDVLASHGHYFLIGLIAAIVANTTGAGGGIVFFPAFVAMGVPAYTALATSFAIQCFGMTAGALAWRRVRLAELVPQSWSLFKPLLLWSAPCSVAGLLLCQWLWPNPPLSVHTLFSWFSIFVGFSLFFRLYRVRRYEQEENKTTIAEPVLMISVAVVSFIGGIITAWLSIGVGELIAVWLMLLGVGVNLAVAVAVTVSAMSVWFAMPYHIAITQWVDTDIVLFAAPAAAIGGTLAGWIATKVGPMRLKLFVATWVTLSGVAYLILNP